jgi:hypothetical protein
MMRPTLLLGVLFVVMVGSASAQQDRAQILEKAKAKFEKEMAKADETLQSAIDKAIAQATKTGNKAQLEKLNYERPLFVTQHLIPTGVPTDAVSYLRERSKATTALLAAYNPAIAELTKTKKLEEANALEDTLNGILLAARGYGSAFPDIEAHPELVFMIENKATGLVVDTEIENGRGKLILTPKTGRPKAGQCWQLEREEKGFLIRNLKSKNYFQTAGIVANPEGDAVPSLSAGVFNHKNETPASVQFKLISYRRDFLIEPTANEDDTVVTPYEKKVKGVTTTYLTREKKDASKASSQLWKLVEVR